MRISDWSSDVCSSDLLLLAALQHDQRLALLVAQVLRVDLEMLDDGAQPEPQFVHVVFVVPDDDASLAPDLESDRKSVVSGKSVSVRVDLGGRRIIKKKQTN